MSRSSSRRASVEPSIAALDRAVADDERDGRREAVGNRPRERVAPAGDERHVDAGGDGVVNRLAVGLRHAPVAVEQRAVDVDADQPDHRAVPSVR